MKKEYEYIVVGCGGIGSGALYWLARRAGDQVLGLEQFQLAHPFGASHDHSRVIRMTYHHEAYTRLTPHAYTTWAELERESALQLVFKTGSVELALQNSSHQREIEIYAQAMDAAGIPYERVDGAEVMRRYPQFHIQEPVDVLIQKDTGIVDAIKGNAAHVGLARYHGATVLQGLRVSGVRPVEGGVEVETENGEFTCRRLIITAGAWADPLLAQVGAQLRLTVTQEQVTYYATPNLHAFALGRFPIFIWHGQDVIYGFPVYGEVATKAAIDAGGPVVTTETRTFHADEERETRQEEWLARYLPGFLGPKLYTKTCLYTMPPDRNFVIDSLPDHPQIIVCNGAGHAYKFASLIGKILSELAIDGHTEYPIAPFSLQREAILNPDFEASFHI